MHCAKGGGADGNRQMTNKIFTMRVWEGQIYREELNWMKYEGVNCNGSKRERERKVVTNTEIYCQTNKNKDRKL